MDFVAVNWGVNYELNIVQERWNPSKGFTAFVCFIFYLEVKHLLRRLKRHIKLELNLITHEGHLAKASEVKRSVGSLPCKWCFCM